MKTVKITAVRKIQYEDLMAQYENPIEHACDLLEGQSWISTDGQCPQGLCPEAWKSMREFVEALARGEGNFFDGWMKNPYSAMISCNDGFRPVSFYIEALEASEASRSSEATKSSESYQATEASKSSEATEASEEPLIIRRARLEEIPQMQEIFAAARRFMARSGNPHQWAADYPSDQQLQSDITSGDSYVMLHEGRIVATFLLRGGIDPTYHIIYDGAWINDQPYATIHRIASSGEVKGIFHRVMQFARQQYNNIRIDTHRDNAVMQGALRKEGFVYCGIIHCWNGSERLAYHYCTNHPSES